MTTLEASFESDLREALLDDAEDVLAEWAESLADIAEQEFREYADRNDYDIEHIWQDDSVGEVSRSDSGVEVRVEWPELTALFEYGVDPHTIEGNPLLHFYYERIDQWITTESVDWGSETGGIPEARAIRTALDVVRVNAGGTVVR